MSRFAQPSSFLFADDPLSEEPSGYGPHNASLNTALLRVDPLGVVHYDKPATGNATNASKNKAPIGGGGPDSDEDGAGDAKPAGSTLGGLYRSIAAAAHNPLRPQNNETISKTPKLICEPVPFLRPKVLPKSVTDARRFAPPGLCHSSAVGFESEDIIILFGGALQDTVLPTNDTWMYQVSDRRWNRLDTLEIATEALQQVRRRRGLSGDILPAPRSGHCAVAIRDTVLDQPISLQFKNRKAAKGSALSYAPNDPFAPALTDSAVDSSLLFPSTANASTTPYSPLKGGTKQPFSPVNHNVGGPSDPDQWSYRPSMLVFGGSNVSLGATYNDLWLFDVQCRAWKELSPLGTPPTPRWKCTGAALEQRMFIFGGENSSFDIVNELHMYDHISGMWRELRVVEPCPRPRLGHACAVVGHKMIIAGGLDKQSYLDHVALMLQTASGNTNSTTSRKGSLNISPQNKNSDLDSISDVWCLDMRTLLWRELATQDKKNSPFAVIAAAAPNRPHHHLGKPSSRRQSGQSDQLGRMRASSMSPARRDSIAAHADDISFGCMEGHVLLPFDDSVIVHGGTLNGKLNTRIFSLNVANELWSFHGEINTTTANSTNKLLKAQRALQAGIGAEPEDPMAIITSGMERKPQPRAQHAGCAFVSKMALQSLGNFAALGNVSLSTGLTPGTFSTATSTVPTLGGGSTSASAGVSQHTVHMSQPKETGPLIAQLAVPLAQQVSTRGLVTVYKNKPVIHKTTHVFFFGGMSFPRSVSDMWCLKLDIPISHQNVDDSDHTIGDRILAASKAGIVGNNTVLGDKLLKMKPMGLGGSDSRATSTREEDGTFARSQREPAPEYYFPALAIKNEEDLEVERLAYEAKLKSLDQAVASGAGDPGSPTKKVGFAPPAVEVRTPPRSHITSPTSEKAFQSESSSSDSDEEARTAEESAKRESERMRRRMATLREQIVNDAKAYILGSHHRPIHRSTGGSN